MPQIAFTLSHTALEYLLAAFSKDYPEQVEDGSGGMMPNPVSRAEYARAMVANLLRQRIKDHIARATREQAMRTIREAELAAQEIVNNLEVT